MAKLSSLGKSFLLSSILAFLSYIKFEYLAKSTLIFCAVTFINDPFPPTSRIISIAGVIVVLILGTIERTWKQGQEPLERETQQQQQQTTSSSNTTNAKKKNTKLQKKQK
jgi:hypothetical protein